MKALTDGAASISLSLALSLALPIAALMDKRFIRPSESIIKEDSSPKDVTLKKAKKSSVRKRARSLCRPLAFSVTSPTESPL